MSPPRRNHILAASSIFLAAIASGAQDQPSAPSKVLPTPGVAVAAPSRRHVSPVSGRSIAIGIEPKDHDSDAEEAAEIARDKAPASAPPRLMARRDAAKKVAPVPPGIPFNEFFNGADRAAAKLSIANSPPEPFGDLKKLIDSLPTKDAMVHHTPRIGRGPDSGRVAEENRNVRVRCWLYMASPQTSVM